MEMKLYRLFMCNGQQLDDLEQTIEVLVAKDLEEARRESVEVVQKWKHYTGGAVREMVASDSKNDKEYWSVWEDGKKVDSLVVPTFNNLDSEGVSWFYVGEADIVNGYKLEKLEVSKVEQEAVAGEVN